MSNRMNTVVDDTGEFLDGCFNDSNSLTYYCCLLFLAPAPGAFAMTLAAPTSSQFCGLIGKRLPPSFHREPSPRSERIFVLTVLSRCPCPTNFGQTTRTGRSSISPNYQHILESDRTSCH